MLMVARKRSPSRATLELEDVGNFSFRCRNSSVMVVDFVLKMVKMAGKTNTKKKGA